MDEPYFRGNENRLFQFKNPSMDETIAQSGTESQPKYSRPRTEQTEETVPLPESEYQTVRRRDYFGRNITKKDATAAAVKAGYPSILDDDGNAKDKTKGQAFFYILRSECFIPYKRRKTRKTL